jgi:hypothetical protein
VGDGHPLTQATKETKGSSPVPVGPAILKLSIASSVQDRLKANTIYSPYKHFYVQILSSDYIENKCYIGSSETSVHRYQPAWRHIQEQTDVNGQAAATYIGTLFSVVCAENCGLFRLPLSEDKQLR